MDTERDLSGELAARFREIAGQASTEEDVRVRVEQSLVDAFHELGLEPEAKYEKTLLRGRADAVYGHLIIEYEAPGKLTTKPGYAETTGQLTQFLSEQAQLIDPVDTQSALRRMVGVSLDGTHLVFCQYRHGPGDDADIADEAGVLPGMQLSLLPDQELVEGFDIRGPVEVSPASVSLLLGCFRMMARPPLTADALRDSFGPTGPAARDLVPVLYKHVTEDPTPRTESFFEEWKRIFGIVYGSDTDKAERQTNDLSQKYGIQTEEPEFLPLLFSIHTYFAALMKLLAVEVLALQSGALVAPFIRQLTALTDSELQLQMRALELGELFEHFGIGNFLEGDFFQWYVYDWTPELADGIRGLARKLDQFEPPSGLIQPERAEDLLKELYQELIPKKLRHDLGEYYTPDWLAEYLLDRAGYKGDPSERLLDPACGSGTFLVQEIRRLRRRCLQEGKSLSETAELVIKNVVGFEINPLAVIAARTNYLLALGDLVREIAPLNIPVYFCDSILTPDLEADEHGQLELAVKDLQNVYTYKSAVAEFPIPAEVVDTGKVDQLANEIERCLHLDYTPGEFAEEMLRTLGLRADDAGKCLEILFEKMLELDHSGANGIWARVIKNSVAPLNIGKFDYVIGNPPWIQWEDLSRDYRDATASLWQDYGLSWDAVSSKSKGLGSTKRDFSMLFAYLSSERYLRKGGRLGFLITQTVFQTDAGSLFRHFRTPRGSVFKVLAVDDFVDINPFDASNWSASFVWEEGRATKYPVDYQLWTRRPGSRLTSRASLAKATATTRQHLLKAEPLNVSDDSSAWLIAEEGAHNSLRHVHTGNQHYSATTGLITWLDGVYLVKVIDKRGDGKLIVENLQKGKKEVPHHRSAVEPELVYPYIPWRNMRRWTAEPECSILIPHTQESGATPIPLGEMRENFPDALRFFHNFKSHLENRSGYKQLHSESEFYVLGNAGGDWHAPYKVVFRAMGQDVRSAIFRRRDWYGLKQPEVHKNTASYIALDSEDEALYLCGMLNSSFVTAFALASSVRGGKSFATTGLLGNVRPPRYEQTEAQRAVVEYGKKIIEGQVEEDPEHLDVLVGRVWDIPEQATAAIRATAELLG